MVISTAFTTVSMIWFASELLLAFLWRSKSTDIRRDESSQKIIWVVILISVSLGVFFKMQQFGHYGSDSKLSHIIGSALILGGLVLRWVAVFSLKQQFTVDVAITDHHRLVREGIYRYLRHPAYSGILLSFLGLGLSFSSYASLIVIIVPITTAFLYRIGIEERVLVETFGDEYHAYCSTTKRLVPFVY